MVIDGYFICPGVLYEIMALPQKLFEISAFQTASCMEYTQPINSTASPEEAIQTQVVVL